MVSNMISYRALGHIKVRADLKPFITSLLSFPSIRSNAYKVCSSSLSPFTYGRTYTHADTDTFRSLSHLSALPTLSSTSSSSPYSLRTCNQASIRRGHLYTHHVANCFNNRVDASYSFSSSYSYSSSYLLVRRHFSSDSSHSQRATNASSSASPSPSPAHSLASTSTPAPPNRLSLFIFYLASKRRLIYRLLLFIAILYMLPSVLPDRWMFFLNDHVLFYLTMSARLLRDLRLVLSMIADYYYTLRICSYTNEIEYEGAKHAAHARNAKLMKRIFEANGGTYIKFGQLIAQMTHLCPDEYTAEMQSMLDQAPISSWHDVKQQIESDFGLTIDQLFAAIRTTPLASASLAQVHEATLLDGTRVAVKVQHRHLRYSAAADLTIASALVNIAYRLFGEVADFRWMAEEMKTHLPNELNFIHEASNAERQAYLFHSRDDVHIPRVYWTHTSQHVLTMEFVEGCRITDLDALYKAGLNADDVARLVTEVVSQQVFIHGLIHADPHPANLLIRSHPNDSSRPQLLLLDHGLYLELDDNFRILYSKLWKALILADPKSIEKYCRMLNGQEFYHLLAAMLTYQPYQAIVKNDFDHLVAKTDASALEETKKYAAEYAQHVQRMLTRVPRPLLLLFKMNDCIRNIQLTLGTSVADFIIIARFCTKALNDYRSGVRTNNVLTAFAAIGQQKDAPYILHDEKDALYMLYALPVVGRIFIAIANTYDRMMMETRIASFFIYQSAIYAVHKLKRAFTPYRDANVIMLQKPLAV